MKRLRRVHPLYYLALLLFIAALVASAVTADSAGGVSRSASVYDAGPGGTAALRKYLEAMGASTTTVQGDVFTADPSEVGVLFMLGPSETITALDAAAVRRFVTAGGTAVLATDTGILEGALLDAFDLHVAGALGPGQSPVGGITFADPPARAIALDRGVTLSLGPGRVPLATTSGRAFVALAREGTGSLIVIGSVAPFLTAQLGEVENGRFALALAGPAIARGLSVAFDEYHHGVHPTTDVLVLLTQTWPGRALTFAGMAFFLYLVASGRRLGPSIPLDPRPPRSSLEYIRGFAGLIRRSGHGEIARRRLRRELRTALARELGLDPETPVGDIIAEIATTDRERAARARSLDEALARPLRDDVLLRTVREIGLVTKRETGGTA
ncbi:MAG: DUF4350 domain-containing protein [Chloroflexota bacterium]|nr:DUF4350 domain-containing protein [Chloroflexota bacterium]